MLLSALPNIALALVLAYFLLSVLTTIINEFISTTLKLRSKTLVAAIKALVDDKTIRTLFYDSGLIKSTDVSAVKIDEAARPSYIDGKTFAGGLLNALGHGGAAFNLDGLKLRIEGLGGGLLKDSLKSVIATSAADLISVQTGIATWFDSAMDRLTGDYVRMMKWISLAVGLVLALSLNVDTLRIGYYVGQHPELAASYEKLAKQTSETYKDSVVPECKESDPSTELVCRLKQAAEAKALLEQLPVGWTGDVPDKDMLTWVVLKFFGLLLTGLAISLGAPLWFDILQNLMNFRGAGTKQEPTKKEPNKG